MRHELSPELKGRFFVYEGMRVQVEGKTGHVIHLFNPDPKYTFWSAEGGRVLVKLDTAPETCYNINQLTAAPLPLYPLDSCDLKHGNYIEEDFLKGTISCEDCGRVYGYLYQVQLFTGDPTGIMGTSYYHTVKGQYIRLPMFRERHEAVDYLKGLGKYGNVQRYCADIKLLKGECKESAIGYDEYSYSPPYPWLTAGITDIVNAPEATHAHMSVMSACSKNPPTIHVKE